MRIQRIVLPLAAAALACCRSDPWGANVKTWGTMRSVMRDGLTEGRVGLTEAIADVGDPSAAVGIGALEGLTGEVAILDGEAWVARVKDGQLVCGRGAEPGDRATLLAVSRVRAWRTIEVGSNLTPEELDALLAHTAADSGLGAAEPWPFVIEGHLVNVEAHVLNGQCPAAGPVEAAHEPFRRSMADVKGTLVGYFAPRSEGLLVHHGQSSHIHVVLEQPEIYTAHVDRAGVRAGAKLRVPCR